MSPRISTHPRIFPASPCAFYGELQTGILEFSHLVARKTKTILFEEMRILSTFAKDMKKSNYLVIPDYSDIIVKIVHLTR